MSGGAQRAGADTAGAPVADDKLIYFAALDNMLRALDRRNGNLRWSRSLPSRPAAGPLRTGDVVLVPFVTTDIGAFTATTGAPAFTIRAVGEIGGVAVHSRIGAADGAGSGRDEPRGRAAGIRAADRATAGAARRIARRQGRELKEL